LCDSDMIAHHREYGERSGPIIRLQAGAE